MPGRFFSAQPIPKVRIKCLTSLERINIQNVLNYPKKQHRRQPIFPVKFDSSMDHQSLPDKRLFRLV